MAKSAKLSRKAELSMSRRDILITKKEHRNIDILVFIVFCGGTHFCGPYYDYCHENVTINDFNFYRTPWRMTIINIFL